MPNLIQIKRSDSTATPGSLANGELAFSAASNVLFVGIKNTVVPIAGGRTPGTLVANQAIVVNASSLVDTIRVGNTGTNVTTNTSGIFLANASSNTRLTIPSSAEWTSGSYWLNANGQWSTIPAAATSLDGLNDVTITTVANNDLLVYNNTSSQWVNKAAGNGFTFSSQTPAVLAANGIQVTSSGVNVLAGNSQIVSNATGVWISSVTAAQINGDIALGTQTSGNYVATITAGNGLTGTATGEGSTPTLAVGAGSGITVNADDVAVTAANGIVVTAAGVNVLAGNNQLISNTTGVWVDQSKLNHDALLNYDANRHVDHTAVSITAGNGLTGGGTIAASRTIDVGAGNGITVAADAVAVLANNGLVANATGVYVLANSGITSNSTGTFVTAGTGVTVNATGVHIGQAVGTTSAVTFQDLTVNGNTVLGDATTDRIAINGYVNTAIVPDANNTRDLGTTALRWNNIFGKDITANTLSIGADVTVSGNLVVSGDLVTLNVSTLTVEDPLIELARLNAADILDIGFYGLYVETATNKYTGLFRDASDSDKFKLFNGLTVAPTTTVDTGGAGYSQGTLVSYIEAGGLITNATHVAITANSTVNVSISANTITLSSPLVGTSGGTGLAAYTAEDILVANSTNGFRKLAAGTDGQVLQSVSGVVAYGSLDGGTF